MEKTILDLYRHAVGRACVSIEALPLSGSARKYYRIQGDECSYIGVYHANLRENQLFVDFTRKFGRVGLHVPKIYAVAEDEYTYLQEDLGYSTLLNVLEKERKNTFLPEHVMDLYRKALCELLRFQLIGGKELDYSNCLPRPVFDYRCIMWDLNYFKYCFLKLTGVNVDEQLLEDEFEILSRKLCQESTNSFMFRDFQSRNIMVKDNQVYFVDYQGGRKGALQYDVASLLYDAIVEMPDQQREELLEYYITHLKAYQDIDTTSFRIAYRHFVLVRLLQALGAFGLRGLHERKQHFIDSIIPGLRTVIKLLEAHREVLIYPELERELKNVLSLFLSSNLQEHGEWI